MANDLIFVDTSAWYAFIDKDDADHAKASGFIESLDSPLITSNYIFDEILTLVKARLGYHVAVEIGGKLWNQEAALLARVTEKDESKAWKLFVQYQDKGFSFTDCASFALMERLGIEKAFAFDDHFAQYGKFIVVP